MLAAAFVALSVLVLSACDAEPTDNGDSSSSSTGSEGPLRARLGSGGQSLFAPKSTPWSGTFGDVVLCTANGEVVTLTHVSYDWKHEPVAVRTLVRQVPDAEDRAGVGPDSAWMPIGGLLGEPGAFADEGDQLGDFSPDVAGTKVSRSCPEKYSPDDAFTEVVTVISSGREGAWSSGVVVGYRDEFGAAHTLQLPWNYVMCGQEISDQTWCPDS